MLALGFVTWAVATLLVATMARSAGGARGGLLLALGLLPLPFVIPAPPLGRLLLASALVLLALRAADLVARPLRGSFAGRWAHLVLLPDVRFATITRRRLDTRLAIRALALLVATGVLAVVFLTMASGTDWHRVFLWLLVALAVVVVFELAVALIELLGTALGYDLPRINEAPWLSRTVGEFWARRWNRVISRLLEDLCFRPFARRSLPLALVVTFTASAAVHAYVMAAATDWRVGLIWGLFFLAQPPVILAERRLGVRRWPVTAGRAWTVTVFVLLLPLFADPMLRLAGLV